VNLGLGPVRPLSGAAGGSAQAATSFLEKILLDVVGN
jgi:hypothetical protein